MAVTAEDGREGNGGWERLADARPPNQGAEGLGSVSQHKPTEGVVQAHRFLRGCGSQDSVRPWPKPSSPVLLHPWMENRSGRTPQGRQTLSSLLPAASLEGWAKPGGTMTKPPLFLVHGG